MVVRRESGGEERESFLLHCSRDITHDMSSLCFSLCLEQNDERG